MLDLAAARALEVAGEQGLELHDQRVLFDPPDLLLHQVRSELHRQVEWHRHELLPPYPWNIQLVCLMMSVCQRNRNHAAPSTPPTPGPRWSPPLGTSLQFRATTARAPSRSSLTRASPGARFTTTSATRRTCSAR